MVSEETRTYDRHGRLVEIASGSKSVRYSYDKAGRVAKQEVDGRMIALSYTKHGRLADKTLTSALGILSNVRYWYGKDGKIVARLANGVSQKYFYDAKGQLLKVVALDGTVCERYAYDPAGNILEKEIGGKTTKYAYDEANQLVSSTAPDGTVTQYAYDAAGRLVKEGARTYRYGYLDKVLSVTEGKERRTFTYHADGQLATATYDGPPKDGAPSTKDGSASGKRHSCRFPEDFLWDGLSLIQRGSTSYVNEPHPNGGSPILSSKDGVMFNDILGTTVGTDGKDGYAAASLTAFGDPVPGGPRSVAADALFTGKPHVDGLGYAFLFRNYRPALGKWQTADPLGYPDGWNRLAYGVNSPMSGIDFLGASWGNWEMLAYYFRYVPEIVSSSAGISPLAAALWGIRVLGTNDYIDTDVMGLTNSIYNAMIVDAKRSMNDYVRRAISGASGRDSKSSHSFIVDCECIVFALGSGSGILLDPISWSWYTSTESFGGHLYEVKYFEWSYYGDMKYSDSFADPVDILNWLHAPNIEVPGGVPYSYGHLWENISLNGQGKIYRLLE